MQRAINSTQSGILLDTDVVSFIFDNKPQAKLFNPYLIDRDIAISFITLGELYHGAFKSKWGAVRISALERLLQKYILFPYEYDLCLLWGKIKTSCEQEGHPIEDSDCWIAASAIYYDCALATNNTKHFIHVNGLRLVSPLLFGKDR